MAIVYNILLVIFVLNCFLLVLTILLQSSKSSGAGMFGGGNSSVFGANSGDILVKITSVMVFIFLLLGIILSYLKINTQVDIDSLKKEFLTKPKTEDVKVDDTTKQTTQEANTVAPNTTTPVQPLSTTPSTTEPVTIPSATK